MRETFKIANTKLNIDSNVYLRESIESFLRSWCPLPLFGQVDSGSWKR